MTGPGLYWYCIHCERAFLKSECGHFRFRGVDVATCCYLGCDGTWADLFEWSNVREGREGHYPEVPRRGVIYPLYE